MKKILVMAIALLAAAALSALNFSSPAETFSDYVIEELSGELIEGGKITVVDRRNITAIRQEMNLQLSGYVSDESALSIGRLLGAHYIISGSLTDMGANNRPPLEGLIFHSDRGIQYCSEEFRAAVKKCCPTVRQSMSRKGNCWDNACAESFFKSLKVELDVLEGNHSVKEVKAAVFEYYYNRKRRHSTLGYATSIAL